eukprot:TRINITY_DN4993_c0_g1_i4.p1 TRINITY_DN4993_c0_g1~~TRINITY_DN4993_c0_g1_i4.p1  ORF type:complete len:909 (-),score=67.87 TRINITY_DN4993_c0_g1_i4:283-3009(-)
MTWPKHTNRLVSGKVFVWDFAGKAVQVFDAFDNLPVSSLKWIRPSTKGFPPLWLTLFVATKENLKIFCVSYGRVVPIGRFPSRHQVGRSMVLSHIEPCSRVFHLDATHLEHWDDYKKEPNDSYFEYNSLKEPEIKHSGIFKGFGHVKETIDMNELLLKPEAVLTHDDKLLIVLQDDAVLCYEVSDNPTLAYLLSHVLGHLNFDNDTDALKYIGANDCYRYRDCMSLGINSNSKIMSVVSVDRLFVVFHCDSIEGWTIPLTSTFPYTILDLKKVVEGSLQSICEVSGTVVTAEEPSCGPIELEDTVGIEYFALNDSNSDMDIEYSDTEGTVENFSNLEYARHPTKTKDIIETFETTGDSVIPPEKISDSESTPYSPNSCTPEDLPWMAPAVHIENPPAASSSNYPQAPSAGHPDRTPGHNDGASSGQQSSQSPLQAHSRMWVGGSQVFPSGNHSMSRLQITHPLYSPYSGWYHRPQYAPYVPIPYPPHPHPTSPVGLPQPSDFVPFCYPNMITRLSQPPPWGCFPAAAPTMSQSQPMRLASADYPTSSQSLTSRSVLSAYPTSSQPWYQTMVPDPTLSPRLPHPQPLVPMGTMADSVHSSRLRTSAPPPPESPPVRADKDGHDVTPKSPEASIESESLTRTVDDSSSVTRTSLAKTINLQVATEAKDIEPPIVCEVPTRSVDDSPAAARTSLAKTFSLRRVATEVPKEKGIPTIPHSPNAEVERKGKDDSEATTRRRTVTRSTSGVNKRKMRHDSSLPTQPRKPRKKASTHDELWDLTRDISSRSHSDSDDLESPSRSPIPKPMRKSHKKQQNIREVSKTSSLTELRPNTTTVVEPTKRHLIDLTLDEEVGSPSCEKQVELEQLLLEQRVLMEQGIFVPATQFPVALAIPVEEEEEEREWNMDLNISLP